jgi:hypothetical protein
LVVEGPRRHAESEASRLLLGRPRHGHHRAHAELVIESADERDRLRQS